MTILGPDHYVYNIRMVITTEAAITAPESVSHKKSKYRQIHRLPEVTV